MNNNLFFNDSYRPEGANEIEKRVRSREEELILSGYQGDTTVSEGAYRLKLAPVVELISKLFTNHSLPRRKLAAEIHK